MEEWQRLGLDPRQFAYGKWWTPATRDEDPQLLDPQPAPPCGLSTNYVKD